MEMQDIPYEPHFVLEIRWRFHHKHILVLGNKYGGIEVALKISLEHPWSQGNTIGSVYLLNRKLLLGLKTE